MSNTKTQILLTALHLFAKNGFNAVSVHDIANELNLTKGALYKHYKSKQDILDCIIAKMYKLDEERAKHFGVPAEKYDINSSEYKTVTLESIKTFTIAQFTFWTQDEFAADFRKMLTLERFRSPQMTKLYNDCLTTGPVTYMEDIFQELIAHNILKKSPTKQLALEFYASLYLLINIADFTTNHAELKEQLSNYIETFINQNRINPQ